MSSIFDNVTFSNTQTWTVSTDSMTVIGSKPKPVAKKQSTAPSQKPPWESMKPSWSYGHEKKEKKQTASTGQVFICSVCGRRNKHVRVNMDAPCGWEECCVRFCVLVEESSLILREDGRVVYARSVPQ